MAQLEMHHPTYGTRKIEDRQLESYLGTGWTQGAEVVPEPVAASVREVLAAVGDDPVKAREALAAEQSRSNPRPTLVASLVKTSESANTSEV